MEGIKGFLKERAVGDLLPWTAQRECSQRFSVSIARVEGEALREGLLPARYQRNRKTLSTEGQLRLFESRVAVIGCGGLGGYVVEELARLGVGELVVVDPDTFEEHNLNRQLFSSVENLGFSKVEAARQRVEMINPAVTVTAVQQAFNQDNGSQILRRCRLAVDALDSISARLQLAASCAEQGIPMVHGAISGWYGQMGVHYPGDDFLHRIYGAAPEDRGMEKEMGNPSFTPALVASLQVATVCMLLLGLDGGKGNELLFINLLDMQWEKLKV